MKRNTQNGSAHVIVIILLIIMLFAALGVVFYQNFILKKASDGQSQQITPAKTETKKTARVAFNSIIYAIDYPESWTLKIDKTDPAIANSTRVTLLSSNGVVKVDFMVNEGGFGGTCSTEDNTQISYYNVHTNPNKKLTGQPTYIVESMTDRTDSGYSYHIGLTMDGGATHAAVGESICNTSGVGIAAITGYGANKEITQPTITAHIYFPKLVKEGEPVKEMQLVKDLLKTTEYKEAVQILESARKE